MFLLDDLGHVLTERQLGPRILSQSVVALDDVLEQPGARLVLDLSDHHVVEDGAHGEEALRRLAEVVQTRVIKENFLDDECRYGLTELRTSLHDPETQRYYLCLKEEADDRRVIHLDQGTDDSK